LGTHTGWNVYVPSYTLKGAEPRDSPSVGFVSPGYFTTMGIPLLLGRDIDDRDNLSARDVMVVNETFAKYFFGSENPIGRRVGTKEGLYQWEIIGVVKNSKYTALREGPIRMIYVPARPGPWASRTVVDLRTSGNVAALVLRERLVGTVTGLFGGLALVLAAIGLYGLTSYGVARRTREFGIRIAIGARTGSIVGLVVNEALWLLAAGTAAGVAAAWVLGRVVAAMLFGIGPEDPVSTVLAILTLVVAAMLAAWIPACRAARVDPMRALRWD
jgi:putative ABC transport system permease protein